MRVQLRYATYGLAAIFLLVPFQAFLTTWLGAQLGHIDLFRIWKELLLVPLTAFALWIIITKPIARGWLWKTRLLQLILIYVGLHAVLGLLALVSNRVTPEALIYALLINTRFLIFFAVVFVVASYDDWLADHWRKLIMYPAAVVVLFGLAQIWLLPPNFLSHFGYGDATIPALHTVDQKLEYQRIQSTLRGPNPLGAYLVIIASALIWQLLREKRRLPQQLAFGIATLCALFYTYSRSAWLGLVLAGLVMTWLWLPTRRAKQWALTVAAVMLVGFAGLTVGLRNNDRFQNIVFHTDENSQSSDSSNADRSSSLRSGLNDVVSEPWGRGPGTAGPASFRNDGFEARIAENYLLQIGQEVGIVGVTVFVGINGLVVYALWRRRGEMAVVLIATWAGITCINLLSHAWADDTLAYVWWGLAGIALARPISTSSGILNKKRKQSNSHDKSSVKA